MIFEDEAYPPSFLSEPACVSRWDKDPFLLTFMVQNTGFRASATTGNSFTLPKSLMGSSTGPVLLDPRSPETLRHSIEMRRSMDEILHGRAAVVHPMGPQTITIATSSNKTSSSMAASSLVTRIPSQPKGGEAWPPVDNIRTAQSLPVAPVSVPAPSVANHTSSSDPTPTAGGSGIFGMFGSRNKLSTLTEDQPVTTFK